MKRFLIGFAVIVMIIAGALSYLADSDPDGLDTATRQGCTVVQTKAGERLHGECIAQTADQHALSDGPLAGYTVFGKDGWTGVAGILGIAVTALLAGGLFWGVRKRHGGGPAADSYSPEA